MADPPRFSLFQQRFLTGDNPFLVTVFVVVVNLLSLSSSRTGFFVWFWLQTLDDEFLKNHTKVLLRSGASDKICKVKLDGNRLADGWEKFAGDHKFRDGDVLVFRHDGDENFHVSVSPRSNSGDIEHASPSYVDTEDGYIDDDDVESDDDGEDEDDDVGEDELGKVFDEITERISVWFFGFNRFGCEM